MDEVAVESRARMRNEFIEQANDSFGTAGDYEFICECSDPRCTSTLSLSRDEYESVRADSSRFVIALNHENPEIDEAIFESGRFAVIQVLPGEPARQARGDDPRA
jgi:hypothetical protein